MITIDCNHIHIDTFISENEKALELSADTGAPKSVIGKKQVNRILDRLGRRCMPVIRSNRLFRFGDVSSKLFGMIELSIQTPENIPLIHVLLNVVDVNIPALIGLDVLDGNFLMVDNISNHLWHRIVISNGTLEIVDK